MNTIFDPFPPIFIIIVICTVYNIYSALDFSLFWHILTPGVGNSVGSELPSPPSRGLNMPSMKRTKTDYPGVWFIVGAAVGAKKPEKIFYIVYRRDGKLIEEKAGRQFQDDMTPAKANALRMERIQGKTLSNQARREKARAEADKWTIARLWEEYKGHRELTRPLRVDDARFQKYLAPAFGKKEPHELCTLDVSRFAKKALAGLKPQTQKHVLALLKRILHFGAKQGLASVPDTKRLYIALPQVDNKKTEDLTAEELDRLWRVLEKESNTQAAAIMKMALFTGMRRSELFKLRWDDLDFQRGFISIRPENAKGGRGQSIPMSEPARLLLESLPREGEFCFPGNGPGGRRSTIQIASNKIKERAGLPADFRPMHGLRHVYASMLASSGQVDMYTLQRLLTHKSPIMTMRYAHLRDEAMKRAAGVAGDILAGVASQAAGKVIPMAKKAG